MIVVDASVLTTALADDGASGRLARSRMSSEDLAAPAVIDLEVTSVLRRLTLTGGLSAARAVQALDDLVDLPFERTAHAPLLERCWELRGNVTAYDAATSPWPNSSTSRSSPQTSGSPAPAGHGARSR